MCWKTNKLNQRYGLFLRIIMINVRLVGIVKKINTNNCTQGNATLLFAFCTFIMISSICPWNDDKSQTIYESGQGK